MKFLFGILLLAVSTAAPAAEVEANKAVARRVFDEILTRGRFELAGQLYAPAFVNHGRTRDAFLDEDQAAARGWLQVAPDLHIDPEVVLGEGDLVAVLWRATGTNSGSGNGIPATGRPFSGRGITVWRIENGRIQEEWSEFSLLLLLKKLGLLPGMPAPQEEKAAYVRPVERVPQAVRRAVRERNRSIVRSVFEQAVGEGRFDLFDTLYAKNFVNHVDGGESTLQQEIDATAAFRRLAPDLRVRVVKTIAEGDMVAVVYIAEGTNTGPALGYPATGKRFAVRGMSLMRLHQGRITDEWSVLDQYQALDQLGLLPRSK